MAESKDSSRICCKGSSGTLPWPLQENQLPVPMKLLKEFVLHKAISRVCTLLGLKVNIASMLVKQFTSNIRTAAFTRALRPARPSGPLHRKTMASAATDKIVFWDILPAPGGCKFDHLTSQHIVVHTVRENGHLRLAMPLVRLA